jgi:hypothetical protein
MSFGVASTKRGGFAVMNAIHSKTGLALQKAQVLSGVSNDQLAKEFSVSKVQVSRWRHQEDMKFSRVVKLCDRFNLSLDEFERLGR